MNRTAILFLALAILLAHMVAIHQTPDGGLAPPYDAAHVAFRLGRNLVHEGELAWITGGSVHGSYPSLLWIALCAGAERFHVSPILVTQLVGMACALGAVLVATQFSMERRSGLIAPLLLATSGCVAAAGASGTEAGLSMLLLTTTVLAFERRRTWLQRVSGVGLALTQPIATWPLVLLVLLELVDRPPAEEGTRQSRQLVTALLPLAALVALALVRRSVTGQWWTPTAHGLITDPLGQVALGWAYLKGFIVASGSAPLALVPLLLITTRSRHGIGRRALLVSLAWMAGVVWTGGSDLPFWNALAPALPLLFVSIQDAVTRLMDRAPSWQPLVILVLLAGGLASLAASKVPGSLGALQLEDAHRAWMQPSPDLAPYTAPHGRLGLLEEIRRVERLRQMGIFLRDESPKSSVITTGYPGALGYLSRRPVLDLLGRTSPLPGRERTHPWSGAHPANLAASLESAAEESGLVVSVLVNLSGERMRPTGRVQELRTWLGRATTASPESDAVLLTLLDRFEPTSFPVLPEGDQQAVPDTNPAHLLRSLAQGRTPALRLRRRGEHVQALVQHEGPSQVLELRLGLQTPAGERLWMRPNGTWIADRPDLPPPRARVDLLVKTTGTRQVRVLDLPLNTLPPLAATPGAQLTAQLFDWGGGGRSEWAIGAPVTLQL